jgi:hypothetical protein
VWRASPTALLVVLLAGCGGGGGSDSGGGDAKPTTPAATPPQATRPQAKEKLTAAARRLEHALPGRDCKVLVHLILHSIQRGTAPDAPPTKADCAYIEHAVAKDLAGFKLTKAREFGPTGFTEGTGTHAHPGFPVGIVWLLDSDGSWKASYQALFRHQIGVAPILAARADDNARKLLDAIRAPSCAGLWRELNVSSRFVRGNAGHRASFCRRLPAIYKDPGTAFAQIKADAAPQLEPLGQTRDFSFYGLSLANGRYMDLVMSGPLADPHSPELKQHDNPAALELLTVRQPH